MGYKEKLQHPSWLKKRIEIVQRDDFTCRLCGDKETNLQVHHLSYLNGREPWDYPNENFWTLCKHCHGVISVYNIPDGYEVLKIKKYIPKKVVLIIFVLYKQRDSNRQIVGIFDYDQIKETYEFKTVVDDTDLLHILDLLNPTYNGQ